LISAEIITLEAMKTHHKLPRVRVRAHAIVLSDKQYQTQEISNILDVCRQSVSSWIKSWETDGIVGLLDKSRTGRPVELHLLENILIEKVEKSPRSLKKVIAELEKELNINISYSYLKKLCKKAGLRWKRIRQSLRSKRDQAEFERSSEMVAELIRSDTNNEINLCYFDESGFTLEPCVPYAWQPKGEYIELPSSKSKRLNVLGFMDRSSKTDSYVFEGIIDSETVINCFDSFAKKITKTTVVLIDNSPLHTSKKFDKKSTEWLEKGLVVMPIARYSPELNLIEILWRKIKYEWMPFSAYESFEKLKENLFDILANVGENYTISFS
jgi:transposase